MTKPKFLTENFIESAVRFCVYYLAVALTPLLGSLTAHIWDWLAYGYLHPLFTRIHTAFLWLFETLLFFLVGWLLRRKKLIPEKPKEKQSWAPLPRKNLFILTSMAAGSVLMVSAIISFRVKPFYDLGEKVTGYEIWNAVGGIGLNVFRCMWIMAMLVHCARMANILVESYAAPNEEGGAEQNKPRLKLLITAAILMLFGIFDIFTSVVSYPLGVRGVLVALTYVLFYALFPIIYHYTKRNVGKAYLVIMFIYIF